MAKKKKAAKKKVTKRKAAKKKMDEAEISEAKLLLKEWEKNVDLYIDQDKRGFQRIGMFLAIHGGLLIFFTKILEVEPEGFFVAFLVALAGIYLVCVLSPYS
ncbi:MAG: hypothetical protein ACYS18_12110 [Planctomycetota bacterium]|jgi:hypothetical protein